MTTTSTMGFLRALRTHLLTFTTLQGTQLLTRYGTGDAGRLYPVQGPDTVTYPYGVHRLINRQTDGETGGLRETPDLELMLYDRPRAKLALLEGDADLCDQAMLHYLSAAGDVFSTRRRRDTLPPAPAPMDRELCVIRLVYPLVVWPEFLTQYGVAPG